ncbi:MAG: PilZ domain-containing protein [Deltaproteobacteria bacterium]|nr:PilZ domain-containing protein [Deltaproteobacteria bacterium]
MKVDPLQLVFQTAYLYARRLFGMALSPEETRRLGVLCTMFADEGRRRFLRLHVDQGGTLSLPGGQLSAQIVDISAEGCLLELPEELTEERLSERVEVRFTVERDDCRRIFTGVVCRRATGERHLVALRFTGIPLELRLATQHGSIFDALDAGAQA